MNSLGHRDSFRYVFLLHFVVFAIALRCNADQPTHLVVELESRNSELPNYGLSFTRDGGNAVCTESASMRAGVRQSGKGENWEFKSSCRMSVSSEEVSVLVSKLRELPWWSVPDCSEKDSPHTTSRTLFLVRIAEGGRERKWKLDMGCAMGGLQARLLTILWESAPGKKKILCDDVLRRQVDFLESIRRQVR